MTLITIKDLTRFEKSLEKMRKTVRELGSLTTGVNDVMVVNAATAPSASLAFGLAASEKLLKASNAVFEEFEREARFCLGVAPEEGETARDLFNRISLMSDNEFYNLMKKNGIGVIA